MVRLNIADILLSMMPEAVELSPIEHNRMIGAMIDLASARIEAAGESSLFTLLKYLPNHYPGQAPEEFYVPSYFASHEGITGDKMREMIAHEARQFCPNFDELVEERLANTEYLKKITKLVKDGYRVIVETNHRNLPNVVLDKAIDAMTLSRPEYLGDSYFERASVTLAKPISMYGYGFEADPITGLLTPMPRSAVAVTSLTGSVEKAWPGTLTIINSGTVSSDDRSLANGPLLERRQKLIEMQYGFISNVAGSGSEDWHIVVGEKIMNIQQTISPGMARDLVAPRTFVAPRAVAFDAAWHASVWVGDIVEIDTIADAHELQRVIAAHAQELSGEKTIYINDHDVLRRIGRFRSSVRSLGSRAISYMSQLYDNHDVDDLTD